MPGSEKVRRNRADTGRAAKPLGRGGGTNSSITKDDDAASCGRVVRTGDEA